MAKIKVLDFAKNIDRNRKRLINNAKNKGKEVNEYLSLDDIVTINNTIQPSPLSDLCRIRWFDIDGSLLRQEYVSKGQSIQDEPTPSFDNDFLEFVEFVRCDDIVNIQNNIDCGAIYKVKPDEYGRRWTHIFCTFNSVNGMSPKILFMRSQNSTLVGKLYIDWGDGIIDEFSSGTNGNATHTYITEGEYIIKIYGEVEGWSLGNSGGTDTFIDCKQAVDKIYYGDNIKIIGKRSLYYCHSLKIVSLPPKYY